jgi:hemoglobin
MQKQFRRMFLLTFILLTISFAAIAQDKAEPSLYKRLGGYDAIAAVTDDFIPRLATDPLLAKFFAGHSVDSKKHLRQLVVEKVCEATGGPCFYTGRTMKESHNGLGITEEQWTTSNKHFVATLEKFKVPKKEQDELVAIVASLKGDIVVAASSGGK